MVNKILTKKQQLSKLREERDRLKKEKEKCEGEIQNDENLLDLLTFALSKIDQLNQAIESARVKKTSTKYSHFSRHNSLDREIKAQQKILGEIQKTIIRIGTVYTWNKDIKGVKENIELMKSDIIAHRENIESIEKKIQIKNAEIELKKLEQPNEKPDETAKEYDNRLLEWARERERLTTELIAKLLLANKSDNYILNKGFTNLELSSAKRQIKKDKENKNPQDRRDPGQNSNAVKDSAQEAHKYAKEIHRKGVPEGPDSDHKRRWGGAG